MSMAEAAAARVRMMADDFMFENEVKFGNCRL